MKRFVFVTWLFLLAAPQAFAAPFAGWKPLLNPVELHRLLEAHPNAITLADIRALEADDPDAAYAAGHLPAAVSAPYATWRGPPDNPGKMLAQGKLTRLVQALGAQADTPVVVIHQGHNYSDFGAAARVYWTLKTAGLRHLAILDGGFMAWKAADLPISRAAYTPVPSDYPARIQPHWHASAAETAQLLRQADAQFLDARSTEFFQGETWHAAAARPGTIAGAEGFDNKRWFKDGGPRLAPLATIEKLIQDHQLGQTAVTVSFCNTGHWAATNWFVLSELGGISGVKLYPESMVEWSAEGLPMDHAPGRLEWAWLSTKQWLDQRFN